MTPNLTTLALASAVALAPVPCDDPTADPWVTGFRDRIVAYSSLYAFATEQYGEPASCDAEIGMEFDGRSFGIIRFGFGDGIELSVETMPPETSIVTLGSQTGFEAEEPVLEALRAYTAGRGLEIDWNAPEIEADGNEVTRVYWDPEPGLNASARVARVDGVLRWVRFSMAL